MAKNLTEPFYVYRILGEMGETVYIGKGCGRRLHNQKRRFMSDGEVMEWCSTDKQAFRRERDLIAQHNPPLNKSTGGNGATRGLKIDSVPSLYAGVAKIIRRLDSLETNVREYLKNLISEVAISHGQEKMAAGLRPYGIEIR